MHYPASALRRALIGVPGAFYDVPAEEATRGHEGAVQELWQPFDNDAVEEKVAPDAPGMPEAETENPLAASLEHLFEFGAEIDTPQLDSVLGGVEGEKIRKSIEVHGI